MEKKTISETFYCICIAMTMQVAVALLVLWVSPESVAVKQRELSTIYAFAGGLSKETLLQFLITSVLTAVIRFIFMSELIFKNAKPAVRLAWMFTVEVIMISVAVWAFGWFRPKDIRSVFGFLLGFGICLVISIILCLKNEKIRNEEMNQALHRAQKEEKN